MSIEAEAKKAIEELDHAEYDGKVITVSIARPKTEGGRGRENGGGFRDKERGGNRRF
jgi:RNA recognition motif-containing protein